MSGRGLCELRAHGDVGDADLQRQRRERVDQLQLPRAGDGCGEQSEWLFERRERDDQAPPDTQAPTAPGGVTATAVSSRQINLAWTASTDNVGVTNYLVERCQGVGCTTFCAGGDRRGNDVQQHRIDGRDELQLSGAGDGRGGNLSAYSTTASATTPAAPVAFVQVNAAAPQSPAATLAVSFPQAQTAGNLNVVVVGWNAAIGQVQGVSDTSGNVYALAVGPTVKAGFGTQSIYYAPNIRRPGRAPMRYGDICGGGAVCRCADCGYSGVAPGNPVDGVAAGTGDGALSDSGGVTTTNAADLLVGANLVSSTTTGAGAGFTNRVITTAGRRHSGRPYCGCHGYLQCDRPAVDGRVDHAGGGVQGGNGDRRWAGADGVEQSGGDGAVGHAGQSDVDSGDRQHRRDELSGGTLPRRQLRELRLGRDLSDAGVHRPHRRGGDLLHLPRARRRRGRQCGCLLQHLQRHDARAGHRTTVCAGDAGCDAGQRYPDQTSLGEPRPITSAWSAIALNDVRALAAMPSRSSASRLLVPVLVTAASVWIPVTATSCGRRTLPATSGRTRMWDRATTTTNPNLVAAYSFDEGAGTSVADLSGHANTGTIANGAWTTAGKFGKALVFNGTNTVVDHSRRPVSSADHGNDPRGMG